MGVYASNQFGLPGFGTPRVAPLRRIDMKLVGLVVFNNQVIEDDADRLPTDVLFTPALTRTLHHVQFRPGHLVRDAARSRHVPFPRLKRSSSTCFRVGAMPTSRVTSITETKVERAVKPESIALGVFGAIAALAALAIAALAISRQLRSNEEDLYVLRALGASPATNVADGLVGVLGAIVSGSLLAVGGRCLALAAVSARTHPSRLPPSRESRSTGRSWASGFSC